MGIRILYIAVRIISANLLVLTSIFWGGKLEAQWLEGYSHRAKITFDSSMVPGSMPLPGFPVLFVYTDTMLRSTSFGGYVSFADGRDICFTDQDSLTVLDYEIENYDPETGSIAAWIRIPSLLAEVHTDLFLYYGFPEGLPVWDTAGVWSNQYISVWHMHSDPSDVPPQVTDATSYMNHGTTGGDMTVEDLLDGKIARAIQFDGMDDYVTMPVNGFNPDEGTIQLWINLDSIHDTGSDYFFAHRRESPIQDRAYLRVWPSGEWGTGMGNAYDLARGDTLETGSWYHLAIAWSGAEVTGYLNGAQDFGPVSYTGLTAAREIYVMSWMPSSESAIGTLDELRVSRIKRDSAWIVASYLNQAQPESYIQVGSTEVWSAACPVPFDVTGGGTYCPGDTGVSVVLSGSEPGMQYTLLLNDTIRLDTLAGNGNSLTWSPLQAEGIYMVKAENPSDSSVLMMNDSAMISILDLPQLSAHAVSITCFGYDDGSISLMVDSDSPYTVHWSGPGGFTSVEQNPGNLPPGVYQATVTDSVSCVNVSEAITITEPPLLVATVDHVTHLTSYEANDGAVSLSVTGGTTPYAFSWTGTDGFLSSQKNPSDMTVGYYDVVVTDDRLCRDSILMITISVADDPDGLFIPEGFSPNGDGLNDLFVILGIEQFPDNELVVFNRQGVEVLHRENYENDWDGHPEKGKILGDVLPEGTYYFVFSYGDSGIRKGYVYINRE